MWEIRSEVYTDARMRSVLENPGNVAEESLNPTEVFARGAFCPVSGHGAVRPSLRHHLDSHHEEHDAELDLARSTLIWPFWYLFTKSC